LRYRGILLPLLLTVGCVPAWAHEAAQSADEKAVRASFETLLEGMAKRDRAKILERLLPGGLLTFMRDGKPKQITFEAFADKLAAPAPEKIEERIQDPLIRVDDDVAILWARFEFLIDGKVHHCGRDIATFARVEGRWMITSIADNGRSDCGRKAAPG